MPKVLQLRTQARTRSVVQQNEEFESRMLTLRWNPFRHPVPVFSLIHHHVLAVNFRHLGAVMRLRSHHHMYGHPIDRRSLLNRIDKAV